jgi:hypothetical protein
MKLMRSLVKKVKFNKRGFSTILLSLMVSGSVLTTIYFTQKAAVGFLSDLSQSLEEWEKFLVNDSAQKLATYLVASNLVLCRKDGWRGKSVNCKWNTRSGIVNPSEFNLSNPTDSAGGFSLDGYILVEGNQKKYKMTFDLVNWTDTSIENLIGEIPDYVCRNSTNMSIVSGAKCPDYDTLPESSKGTQPCQVGGADKPGTHCEYIKPLDGDYYIVLVKIEVPYEDPVSKLQHVHTSLSAIRRPLSMVVFKSIVSGKRCSRSCHVGGTLAFVPDCRDDAVPTPEQTEYSGLASKIITIRNEGPGALYQLSLVSTKRDISDGTQIKSVTPDIISGAGKEVLFPGETLSVEHFYECPIVVQDEVVYGVSAADSASHTVRNSMVPFARLGYHIHVDVSKLGSCYTSAGDTLSASGADNVEMVLPMRDEAEHLHSIDCNTDDTACRSAGGFCQYVDIEPRRLFSSPVWEIDSVLQQSVTTYTIIRPPLSPPYSPSRSTPAPNWDGNWDGDGGGN